VPPHTDGVLKTYLELPLRRFGSYLFLKEFLLLEGLIESSDCQIKDGIVIGKLNGSCDRTFDFISDIQ
jgi:hypothetical protein